MKITIHANKKTTNHLGVTLDFKSNSFKAYRKLNSGINCINKYNHRAPSVIKNALQSIHNRISVSSMSAAIYLTRNT